MILVPRNNFDFKKFTRVKNVTLNFHKWPLSKFIAGVNFRDFAKYSMELPKVSPAKVSSLKVVLSPSFLLQLHFFFLFFLDDSIV